MKYGVTFLVGDVKPEIMSEVRELLGMQHREIGKGTVNEVKVQQTLQACLQSGAIIGAVEDDRLVGVVGLMVTPLSWYSDDPILSEQFFFVHPDHRRSVHAKNLIKAMKFAAKQVHLPLRSVVFTSKDTDRKVKFFSRHFQMMGAIFWQEG
jgi:hypothetical protein